MQDLQLIWIGDLQIPNSRNGKHKTTFRVPEYHKLLNIGLLDKIVIGNSSEAGRINWTIRSVVGENIISNPHATIERKSDDSFVISDDSTHGTYVNFVRVLDKVALKESDIVCFGYKYGLQIKTGRRVKPYRWDLKYKVHLVPIEKNEFSLRFCKSITSSASNGNIFTTSIPQRVNSQKNVESTRVPHEVVNKTEIKSEALLRTEKRFRTVAERRAATTSPHRYNEFHFEFRRQPSSASIGVQLPSFPVELDETKRGGLSVRKKPNQKSFASANKPNKASFPKHLMRIAPKLIASLSVSEPEMSTSIAVVRTNRQNQALNCKSGQITFIFTSEPATLIPIKEAKIKPCLLTIHSASNSKPDKSIYKQVVENKRCGLSRHKTPNRKSTTSVNELSTSIPDELIKTDFRKPLIVTASNLISTLFANKHSASIPFENVEIEATCHYRDDYENMPPRSICC